MAESITLNELMAELQRLGTPQDSQGRTTGEWGQIWGVSQRKALMLIKAAHRGGYVTVVREPRTSFGSGIVRPTTCYVLNLKAKRK